MRTYEGVTAQVMQHIEKTYGCRPEYLWTKLDCAAIRHKENKKWFAVLMHDLPKTKLGVQKNETADILNLKRDPILDMIDHAHIFPAYHMNKEHWISVILDETTDLEMLYVLIEMSFRLTKK